MASVAPAMGGAKPQITAVAAVASIAAVSAVLGFLAGAWATRTRRRPRSRALCECGVDLSRMSPDEVCSHRKTKRHRTNLTRLSCAEVIVCEEVREYRDAALTLVKEGDVVLEVGCHVGGTTKVLASVTGQNRLVGIDQRAPLVEEARRRLPNVHFEVCDAFDATRILAIAESMRPKRFNKVFVDISGSRALPTVIRLLDVYAHTLRPEVVVVKSQQLKKLLIKGQLWVEHPLSLPQHDTRDSDDCAVNGSAGG